MLRTFAVGTRATRKLRPFAPAKPGRGYFARCPEVRSILRQERTGGNRAVMRRLQAGFAGPDAGLIRPTSPGLGHDHSRTPVRSRGEYEGQTKLTIATPGDEHERDADRLAEQVLRAPDPQWHRPRMGAGRHTRCQKKRAGQEDGRLQAKRIRSSGKGQVAVPPIVNEVLRSQGQPLDAETRNIMEYRFGHDFSRVRVHTDTIAAESARAVGARAYTVGRDIVFGAARHRPDTAAGRRLLAHELVHVLQQGPADASVADATVQKKSDDPALCGGAWTCAASPCEEPDPGRPGDGGKATSWALKIMIDIEAPSAEDVGPSTVGHTYVEFADSTGRAYTYGFYPDKSSGTPDPVFRPQVRGCIVHPDTAHKSCVDYTETFSLTQKEFDGALSFAAMECKSPPVYNIQTWNCTTFAVEIAKTAGKSLPATRGQVGSGTLSTIADNPNKLYEGLKRRDIGPTYAKTGDTEIRNAINGASAVEIVRIPTEEKVRIVNRLLDGWVSDEDIAVIGKVYGNTSDAQRAILKNTIEARILELSDIGQRTQLRMILAGG